MLQMLNDVDRETDDGRRVYLLFAALPILLACMGYFFLEAGSWAAGPLRSTQPGLLLKS